MKSPLVKMQARTLFKIVQFTSSHDGRVPNIKEIANILRIDYGAARGRLKRLVQNGYVHKTRGHNYRLNPSLCTEVESAWFLLKAEELGKGGKIFLGDLRSSTMKESRIRKRNKPDYFNALREKATSTGYMSRIVSAPEYVRLTEQVPNQLEYLRMLTKYL